jgi:hypothetical protein
VRRDDCREVLASLAQNRQAHLRRENARYTFHFAIVVRRSGTPAKTGLIREIELRNLHMGMEFPFNRPDEG